MLDQKYNLFKGVFGSSDEVLGSTMDGIDFEHRVLDIYQTCRTTEEIDAAFARLQEEMRQQIEEVLDKTRTRLIENFDRDVVNKLKVRKSADEQALSQFYQLLWQLTISMLGSSIDKIDSKRYSFTLRQTPADAGQPFSTGPYRMGKDISDAYTYRVGHPLAQYLLAKAKRQDTSDTVGIVFDYTDSPEKMSVIENEVGKYGILAVKIVHYHSPKDDEDCIIATAVDSEGRVMPDDFVEKLMSISGHVSKDFLPVMDDTHLQTEMALKRKALNESIALRDKQFIDEESAKIEQWAEDQTFSLEEELRDVKKRIKEREREFRKETDDHRRRQLQTEIINLQRNQRQKRQELFSLEDEIIVRRDALIAAIDSSLDKAAEEEHLFTIAWQVV